MTAYFEDLRIGEPTELGHHTFAADEIKSFARRYDPQVFHLDEDAAARSHFGALCASGWHTAAIWMRLVVSHHRRLAEEALAAGLRPARLGPSPGFRDLKWLKPVYAGDTLAYTTTVTDKKESASRPQWGIVTMQNGATNQHGVPVFSFIGTVFWERRPA
jgi:acyl dehydratase